MAIHQPIRSKPSQLPGLQGPGLDRNPVYFDLTESMPGTVPKVPSEYAIGKTQISRNDESRVMTQNPTVTDIYISSLTDSHPVANLFLGLVVFVFASPSCEIA